jgi:putative endonuclease
VGALGAYMYYVYVLQSESGILYKGSTDDLRKRFSDHNDGKVKSTKNERPWKLIYYEAFINKIDARREELFLKTGKGRERLGLLLHSLLLNNLFRRVGGTVTR